MNIKKNFLTQNDCYKKGNKINAKGLQLHTIGTAQNSANSLASYWNQPGISACVHYCIDAEKEGTVFQFLPDNYRSWADGGFGNGNLITVELMESDYMKYTNGANFTITNKTKFIADITRAYNTAVEFFAYKCKEYGWDPQEKMSNGLYRVSSHDEGRRLGLSTSHVDPSHLWGHIGKTMDVFRAEVKAKMNGVAVESTPIPTETYYRVRKTWADEKSQLGAYTAKQNAIDNCPSGYKVFDENGKAVYTAKAVSGTQAADFAGLTEAQAAAKILEMCKKDYEKTGVFASVSAAQMILESGYVKTELATKGNNCFGMKTTLSGNTWLNSTWDGKSKVNIRTAEEYTVGKITYINADFRKYPCIEDSIGDHSAYLLGAMNGSKKRYAGLTDCKNYRDAITLIKKGGYATDSAYVSKICNIIERFGLDKYDKIPATSSPSTSTNTSTNNSTSSSTKSTLYRVGTEWKNGKCVNQDGAYASLDNAKKRVDALAQSGKTGYHVFDNKGVSVYPAATAEPVFKPYSVRVDTPSLRIRKAPNGAAKKKLGREMYTGIGTFTIVAEEKAGDYTWGLLKSYEKKRNGWIALEYTKRI